MAGIAQPFCVQEGLYRAGTLAGGMMEDWKTVPRDPTVEMLDAASRGIDRGYTDMDCIWSAMFDAAPPSEPWAERYKRQYYISQRLRELVETAAFQLRECGREAFADELEQGIQDAENSLAWTYRPMP